MEFEWDEEKQIKNLTKHQVDFLEAQLIFEDDCVTWQDMRIDYGEDRFISIGVVGLNCFVVVYTLRGEIVRLISAWKGGEDERRRYRAYVASRSTGEI